MQERPGERYWRAVEPVWRMIDIYGPPADFLAQYASVPIAVGHLFASHWCQSEVCNGGLHQFFSNPTGVLAPEAIVGLRAIGLVDLADIVAEAARVFATPYPREQAARVQILDQYVGDEREDWDPFFRLDDQFFLALDSVPDRFYKAADAYASGSGVA